VPQFDYDMLVIGSGPAGQRASIQAAKLRKKVAVLERKAVVGGVSINTGTIPSKTLREAVLYLSGYTERGVYGAAYAVKRDITIEDLLFRVDHVIKNEREVIRHQMARNGVELISAAASFLDPHTLQLDYVDGASNHQISAEFIVIASGSEATRDEHIPFDGQRIFTPDDVLNLNCIPRTLTIVGGGVIGSEYASIFAALGMRVTLVEARNQLLSFVDDEISDALVYQMRQNRATIRLGETVSNIEPIDDERGQHVKITLASGKQIVSDQALYSIGRTGATADLNLPAAGLEADERGRLPVSGYRTQVPNIFAVGDVIGFPSLAATSMEQGRLAACQAFGIDTSSVPELFPYGVYTIPEISMVGRTEQELTADGVPYEVGKAQYREIARGQIIGDSRGLLKLLFHLDTRQLLGVHIIGAGASELVHIGQAVLAFGGDLNYFLNTVFNYPTLAECYKTAALDAANRLDG
jgi:NAD(P) transhydrogenase